MSGLPKFLWGEVAKHVVWLLNRMTTKAVEGMTPYKAAFGKKPNLKGICDTAGTGWCFPQKNPFLDMFCDF